MLGGHFLVSSATTQNVVATSSGEDELYAFGQECIESSGSGGHGSRHGEGGETVKSIPLNTENWLRKRYNYSMNNDTSTEDKHETNYSMNNDMRNMHITLACTESAQSLSHCVHLASHAPFWLESESRHLSSMYMCVSP